MRGWLPDFFRLIWALVYWNIRKSWFQLRRARGPAPCQSPSDSGLALATQCEACLTWVRPRRFRRVCPLLVDTKDGLRCSVNAPDVRPFWGRTVRYYGASGLVMYGLAVLVVFASLRMIGYPVSVVHVGFPPLWHRVNEARSSFFLDRSNRAFADGRTVEGLLYLANAYEFEPGNYAAGIALAKNHQAARPRWSDEIFQRLLREHPDRAAATAQDWFRALLARGDYETITVLARGQLAAGAPHAGAWMRALLFANRRTANVAVLHELRAEQLPAIAAWHPVLEVELLLRTGRGAEARRMLDQAWPGALPPFALYYRIDQLIGLGEVTAALDLLERHPGVLDDEARVTLRLHGYATANARQLLQREVDALLAPRLGLPENLPRVKILCAHLMRHPDRALFAQLDAKLHREPPPLDSETAGIWFSLLCTAGAVGDYAQLHEHTQRLRDASRTPFAALTLLEAFFRGEAQGHRMTTFLPILPLPLEVTYALIERYPPPQST